MKWTSGLKPRFENQVQTWKWKTWKWEAEFHHEKNHLKPGNGHFLVYFNKSIVSRLNESSVYTQYTIWVYFLVRNLLIFFWRIWCPSVFLTRKVKQKSSFSERKSRSTTNSSTIREKIPIRKVAEATKWYLFACLFLPKKGCFREFFIL